MVTEAELKELYRPYDTLKAIGLTKEEAKSFLARVENLAPSQNVSEPKSEAEIVVKYSAQRSERRRCRSKSLLLIGWGYAVAVWLYVVAMQLVYPNSVYWSLATWLPIRMDYVGEGAFIFSFIVAGAVTMWNARLSLRTGRNPAKPDAGPAP